MGERGGGKDGRREREGTRLKKGGREEGAGEAREGKIYERPERL